MGIQTPEELFTKYRVKCIKYEFHFITITQRGHFVSFNLKGKFTTGLVQPSIIHDQYITGWMAPDATTGGISHQGPLLLTWINFNPSMDKLSQAQ